jgi:hypothetical protein
LLLLLLMMLSLMLKTNASAASERNNGVAHSVQTNAAHKTQVQRKKQLSGCRMCLRF